MGHPFTTIREMPEQKGCEFPVATQSRSLPQITSTLVSAVMSFAVACEPRYLQTLSASTKFTDLDLTADIAKGDPRHRLNEADHLTSKASRKPAE